MAEADLAAFLDDFFERELEPQEVVGAGVAIVRDGRLLAARGYGFADRESGTPVVPEETLFPAQSVSKLFAATAAMQLVEAGRVDLDADIRPHLGSVPIESDFEEPVTLGHLLTHTAGFDDSYVGFLPRDDDDTIPVSEFATLYRREVIFQPGTVHAYSNYASLLARVVVSQVTGRTYEDYVREEVMAPLGMVRSCLLPPPPEWADRLATGYLPSAEGLESTRDAFPDGLIRFRTATGTLATTVVDMARFMIAHLEGGAVEEGRILEPATVQRMHAQQFAQHPSAPGATYGFFESVAGGERGIFHFGSGFGYGTFLYLMPESRTGIYLAHSNSSSRIGEALLLALLDRYYARQAQPAMPAAAGLSGDVERFSGYYVPVRRADSTFEKLPLTLVQGKLRAEDGRTLANDQVLPRRWVQTGSRVFERPEGGGVVAFDGAGDDPARFASIWDEEMPQLLVLERMPWYDTTPLLAARLGWFVLVFVTVVISTPLVALLRRLRRRPSPQGGRVRWAAYAAALFYLVFLVGVAWSFVSRDFMYSVSGAMVALFWLPLVAILPTALALVSAAREREALAGGWLARTSRILTLSTLALFPFFLWRWNLLGFHF